MSNNTMSPVQRFWALIKPDQKEIQNVYLYALFSGLVNLSLPIGIQAIVNLIQGGQISTSWIVLVSFVILGILAAGIMQVQQLKITEILQQKIFARASLEFAYRMPRIKLEALYRHYAPELMNRFFDVISVQKGLSKMLIDFSTASIQTLFGLLLLSMYHPFFIVFSLILIVLAYTIFRLTAKKGLKTSLEESKHKYEVAHWLEEIARTATSFKLAGITDLPMKGADERTEHYIRARESHFKVLVTQYWLMIVFKILVAAGLLIVGGLLVFDQQMNVGQFVAAEIIILLVLNSVEKLILSFETVYDVLSSLEKLGQVSDLELEQNVGMETSSLDEAGAMSVELKNIDFSYPDAPEAVFKNCSLNIEAGKRVLIRGNGGKGKSSLLYLLSGLFTPQKGSILYNDIPAGNLIPDQLRSRIGDCLTEEQLFEGSILDNITMGRPNAKLDRVKWVVEKLGLKDFISSLPNGYQSIIRNQGKLLSGGIADKLILARSIVDQPKLLLIKDQFTSLKGKEREDIMRFLFDRENNWTLVIVSHDPQVEKLVDMIVEVSDQQLIISKK